MRLTTILSACAGAAVAFPTSVTVSGSHNVSQSLFNSLEELARLVDISYCVGSSGIQQPFTCLSRCSDFQGFELVTTWNTGPLLSDSCGYIAISHPPSPKRIIVAFRGTYSIANTVADLSTNPAEYAPFPASGEEDVCLSAQEANTQEPLLPQLLGKQNKRAADEEKKCNNCTVHSGFMTSWRNTRCLIVPHVEQALAQYPDYQVTLVGHSLGGAVAALASLEFKARGWEPQVTTFGEPRIGNQAFINFIDAQFNLTDQDQASSTYRRVTHFNDPVPLLPLEEWGYKMHAGEIYISKASLSPDRNDLRYCEGDEDPACIAGDSSSELGNATDAEMQEMRTAGGMWTVPPRYRLWQLFFAHRDYFWRLGLCVPGGDPTDWWREKYPQDPPADELR